MACFAIPALGIYLANPLLSNIDNDGGQYRNPRAGKPVPSPALSSCTDQLLYLFSFLAPVDDWFGVEISLPRYGTEHREIE
jgi:hypothetical protein